MEIQEPSPQVRMKPLPYPLPQPPKGLSNGRKMEDQAVVVVLPFLRPPPDMRHQF